jgi:hypothetical protein
LDTDSKTCNFFNPLNKSPNYLKKI